MKVGIVSDTHRNTKRPPLAIETFREAGIRRVIHLGDVTNGKVAELFAPFDAWFVYGNADRDLEELRSTVDSLFGSGRLAEYHQLEWEGVKIAAVHGHTDRLGELVNSGHFNIVLHGHTHKRRDEMVARTRVINPGALGGIKWQSRSYAILDLPSGALEYIELE